MLISLIHFQLSSARRSAKRLSRFRNDNEAIIAAVFVVRDPDIFVGGAKVVVGLEVEVTFDEGAKDVVGLEGAVTFDGGATDVVGVRGAVAFVVGAKVGVGLDAVVIIGTVVVRVVGLVVRDVVGLVVPVEVGLEAGVEDDGTPEDAVIVLTVVGLVEEFGVVLISSPHVTKKVVGGSVQQSPLLSDSHW